MSWPASVNWYILAYAREWLSKQCPVYSAPIINHVLFFLIYHWVSILFEIFGTCRGVMWWSYINFFSHSLEMFDTWISYFTAKRWAATTGARAKITTATTTSLSPITTAAKAAEVRGVFTLSGGATISTVAITTVAITVDTTVATTTTMGPMDTLHQAKWCHLLPRGCLPCPQTLQELWRWGKLYHVIIFAWFVSLFRMFRETAATYNESHMFNISWFYLRLRDENVCVGNCVSSSKTLCFWCLYFQTILRLNCLFVFSKNRLILSYVFTGYQFWLCFHPVCLSVLLVLKNDKYTHTHSKTRNQVIQHIFNTEIKQATFQIITEIRQLYCYCENTELYYKIYFY